MTWALTRESRAPVSLLCLPSPASTQGRPSKRVETMHRPWRWMSQERSFKYEEVPRKDNRYLLHHGDQVPHDNVRTEFDQPQISLSNRCCVALLALLIILLTTTTSLLILYLRQHTSTQRPPFRPATQTSPSVSTCGNSSAEAIARGCRMEAMFYGWIPPECYYEEVSSHYDPFTSLKWYSAPHAEDENLVDPADLWAGTNRRVWATTYHKQHCLFLWRKLALAVDQRRSLIDSKTANFEHSVHCVQILDWIPEQPNQIVEVNLRFYDCVNLPWSKPS